MSSQHKVLPRARYTSPTISPKPPELYSKQRTVSPLRSRSTSVFFKQDNNLSTSEEKYCSCVLKVGSEQSTECLQQRNWGKVINGKTCYNPYAVCAKSTRTTSRECGSNYDFDLLDDEYLKTYARLSKIIIPFPYQHNQMVSNIIHWKQENLHK